MSQSSLFANNSILEISGNRPVLDTPAGFTEILRYFAILQPIFARVHEFDRKCIDSGNTPPDFIYLFLSGLQNIHNRWAMDDPCSGTEATAFITKELEEMCPHVKPPLSGILSRIVFSAIANADNNNQPYSCTYYDSINKEFITREFSFVLYRMAGDSFVCIPTQESREVFRSLNAAPDYTSIASRNIIDLVINGEYERAAQLINEIRYDFEGFVTTIKDKLKSLRSSAEIFGMGDNVASDITLLYDEGKNKISECRENSRKWAATFESCVKDREPARNFIRTFENMNCSMDFLESTLNNIRKEADSACLCAFIPRVKSCLPSLEEQILPLIFAIDANADTEVIFDAFVSNVFAPEVSGIMEMNVAFDALGSDLFPHVKPKRAVEGFVYEPSRTAVPRFSREDITAAADWIKNRIENCISLAKLLEEAELRENSRLFLVAHCALFPPDSTYKSEPAVSPQECECSILRATDLILRRI